MWQRVSLGELVCQLEDQSGQNLNPKIAPILLFHQLPPSLLPSSTSSTHHVWRKHLLHLITSGGQVRFRMGYALKTLWALESSSLTFVGWLL